MVRTKPSQIHLQINNIKWKYLLSTYKRILFIDVCVSGNSVKKRYILLKNMAKISFGKSCVIGGHLH